MNIDRNENFNTDEYLRIVSNKLKEKSTTNEQRTVLKSISNKLNDIKEIEFHRSIANRQKNAYNKMIKDIDLLNNKRVHTDLLLLRPNPCVNFIVNLINLCLNFFHSFLSFI